MNPYVKLLLKLGISASIIIFVLSKIHVGAMVDLFFSIKGSVFVTVFGVYVLYFVLSAYKWKIFLPHESFGRLFRYTMIGHFYNLILPGQITGEVAKGYRFARENGDGVRVTASILLDKVTAFGSLVLLGIIGCVFSVANPPFFGVLMIVGFALMLAGFIYAARFKSLFMKTLSLLRVPERILVKIDLFLSHYNLFSTSSRVIALSIILGVLSQGIAIMMNIVLAQSIGVSIGIFEWFWLFSITSFVTLLPITVAGLGLRETVFAASALSLNIRPSLTVAISLMMYGFQVLFACIGGLIELSSFMKKKPQ